MFNTKIQDGRQKWRENIFFFCEIMPIDSADTLRVKKFVQISLHFRDKHVFAFYAEIQDGHQKLRENDFWEKSPIDSANTLWIKNNFVEIVLSCSVSEINPFFRLTQKSKMDAKSCGKMIFEKSRQ